MRDLRVQCLVIATFGGFKLVSLHLRAGILVNISGLIGRLMQCHIRFLVTWRRESEVRERGGCFAKQPSHRLKFRSIIVYISQTISSISFL